MCDDISEFESYMLSHAVESLWAVRNGRRARELAQHQSLCSPSAFSATFSEE